VRAAEDEASEVAVGVITGGERGSITGLKSAHERHLHLC
jgi:hypothetical protein